MNIKLFSKTIFATILWGAILISCASSSDIEPILNVSPSLVSLPAAGGTSEINLNTNDRWNITNSASSWLQLNKISGNSGSTKIQLTAGLNDTGFTRSGMLDISSKNGQLRRIQYYCCLF